MKFFLTVTRGFRLLAEEFASLLIIGIVGAALMLLIIPAPFVLGGYAAVMDDLAERRPVSLGSWWQGARAMWRPAYVWGIMNLLIWLLLFVAFDFYGRVGGGALQGTILVLVYIWYTSQLYFLPLARLHPETHWLHTLRDSVKILVTAPLDTFFLMLILAALFLPLYFVTPPLALLHPIFALLFATILVRVHVGRPATIEAEDLVD